MNDRGAANAAPERLFQGALADEYDMLTLICPAAAEMSREVGRFVAEFGSAARLNRPLEIMELGCGTGVTTACLLVAWPDCRITAVDNEPAMLAKARGNLAEPLASGRCCLVGADALSVLRECPSARYDVIASAYTLHNFLGTYRDQVLAECHRVLRPGGVFVNGDRYALDDSLEHLRLIQGEVREYFRVFIEIARLDLLEAWIVHLFSDESPDHLMRLGPALERLRSVGFTAVHVRRRDGVNALVSGEKR